MLDSVNSVTTRINSSNISGVENLSSKNSSITASTVAVSASVKKIELHSTSAIRVDNLQNVAILEFRSADTGEVVAQFPTQKQIEAFRVAQTILEKSAEKFTNKNKQVLNNNKASPPVLNQTKSENSHSTSTIAPTSVLSAASSYAEAPAASSSSIAVSSSASSSSINTSITV